MKEQLRHLGVVVFVITTLLLQACGSSEDKRVFSIVADVTKAEFSHEFLQESTDTIAIQVNFEGDGLIVGFAPDEQPVGWLSYRAENVTDNSATVYIEVTNAQFLAVDTHTTKIRIATTNDDASKFAAQDIDVSLFVWELATDRAKINFSATFGVSQIPSTTINISSESNVWTASADVNWLSLDVTSGTGDGEIVVTPDVSSFLASGLQQGNIVLTEVTSGDSKLVPVDLALDNVYLFAERSAIALTSTTTISALEQTLTISNNGELTVAWQASTDVDWLTVTQLNDTQLKITADPTTAPMNENSAAEIVISASAGASVINETINVSFYNSNLDVENKVLTALEINNNEMLVSPLAPVFYVGIDNALHAYNQYTGELASSLLVSPEGTLLEQLIMHPNGDYLLAKAIEIVTEEDGSITETIHRYRVNLIDNSITKILEADIAYEPTDIVRLQGRYFVVTQTLEFADENLQVVFWDAANAYFANEIDVATQASTLFALDNNTTTKFANLKRYIPQANDFGDEKISITLTDEYHPQLLGEAQYIRDFIVSNDEKKIYAISETSEWISFDGENFVDNGLLEANSDVVTLFLVKGNDSQPNYFRINTTNALGFYLNSYDAQQTVLHTTFTGQSQPSRIKLSGDNQRLLLNVDTSNDAAVTPHVELKTLSQ